MANLLSYDASQLLVFLLVLIRVGGVLMTAPIFGSSNIPAQIKIVVILVFSLILNPFLPPPCSTRANSSFFDVGFQRVIDWSDPWPDRETPLCRS